MADSAYPYPIIDSHVHVYPSSELESIAWFPKSSPLYRQYSLDEYTAATAAAAPSLKGFIFLEVDRIHDLSPQAKDGTGWDMPLAEVEWAKRVALGTPRGGEGHSAQHSKLCLAIVPWAPVPSGEVILQQYVQEVQKRAGDSFPKIRGFRYLVQDKPRGVMVHEKFIEGLKWLGRNGFVFDVGVNQHKAGKWQLEEAVEMIELAHRGVEEKDKVCFVLNHLCKPDLSIYNLANPSFIAWRTAMYKLSQHSKVYMKLSGCFSEMPDALRAAPVEEVFSALQPYLTVILATFGPSRIMFGTDWPVCSLGVEESWNKWHAVVQRFCSLASLSPADQAMIWSGTSITAYGLTG
ncbi:hypothetical protein K3495_g5944 [Podosphaera aphanis]|nr:hypothetical protein K3495_g5944 [Podosphaera aphanis]